MIPGFSTCPHCSSVAMRLRPEKPIICDGCETPREPQLTRQEEP